MNEKEKKELRERLEKSIARMEKEKEEKNELFKNGIVDHAKKVLSVLNDKNPQFNTEDARYNHNNSDVTEKDINLLFKYLEEYAAFSEKISYQEYDDFWNHSFWFRFEDKIYEGHQVSGQGTDKSFTLTNKFKRGMLFEFSHAETYWQNRLSE